MSVMSENRWSGLWDWKHAVAVCTLSLSTTSVNFYSFPHNNIACIHMCDECTRSNAPSVCHKLFVHFVTARASLFTDHRISGLPIRAKYTHVRTMCEQTVDNSPTDPISSSLNWWSSIHGVATLYTCPVVLSQVRSIFPRISVRDLPCHRTKKMLFLHPVSLKLLWGCTMKISFRHHVSPWLLFLAIFL